MQESDRTAAIFDLDGTLTNRDTYVAFLLCALRRRPQRLIYSMWLPIAVALFKLRLRENSWLKKQFLVIILGGADQESVNSWVDDFIAELLLKNIRSGALNAIRRHRALGHRLVLATASFDFYVEELARRLGFDTVICTRATWDNSGKLVGELAGGNCYGMEKLARVSACFQDNAFRWKTIVYTDNHSDLPLMEWADRAIAVNPTGTLRKIASEKGYEIEDWRNPPST